MKSQRRDTEEGLLALDAEIVICQGYVFQPVMSPNFKQEQVVKTVMNNVTHAMVQVLQNVFHALMI